MAEEARQLIQHLGRSPGPEVALNSLPFNIRTWFTHRFDAPTPAQWHGWPAIAHGDNVLICAPTGTGKTLAAFLPIVGAMLQEPSPGRLRCLYVAPLKALVNDVRRTLRRHVRDLRGPADSNAYSPRIAIRTGDTSTRLRRRLLLEPPDILLTTPESLALLLTVPRACHLFADVRWVIVDEVHSLTSMKRGADLSLSLERLQDTSQGEIQRIGLSATCAPAEEAARFLVGSDRRCQIAQTADDGRLELVIEPLREDTGFLGQLVERMGAELERNRSTLIFTNTRSLAERLGWALRRRFTEWDREIAVHHSSIAAAGRRSVERRFKHGRLRAIVSSTSLELGIDVGAVDGVVLIHPPGEVVRLLQRVGRSGHEPGRLRRGVVLTAGAGELLEAAVTCASLSPAQLESLRVPDAPLDVLCQHLLGMATVGAKTVDDMFAIVRRAYPYRGLTRQDFENCLSYLCGQRADGTEWIPPRLLKTNDSFSLIDQRTLRILRQNVGTIIEDEPRRVMLRLCQGADEELDSEREVGSLDEAFADRLQPGDRFLLDGRCLECRDAGPAEVLVDEVVGRPAVPRWRSEPSLLGPELAQRIFLLRVQAADALREGGTAALRKLLRQDYSLQTTAVEELVALFECQDYVSEIPGARVLLLESVHNGGGWEYYVHTPLAHAANDALARVAVFRLARDFGASATSVVADLGFAILMRRSLPLAPDVMLRRLLARENFDEDIDRSLSDSITLRERFRKVATIGLMLLRQPLGGRRRVGGQNWADRRLFDRVRTIEPAFVLMRQAWCETRNAIDAAGAKSYVKRLSQFEVRCRKLESVSPFATSWTQQVAGPVARSESPTEAMERLHQSLFGRAAV